MHRLHIPMQLRKTLASTNVIESAFSIVERVCRNVTRWHGGDPRERLEIALHFLRLRLEIRVLEPGALLRAVHPVDPGRVVAGDGGGNGGVIGDVGRVRLRGWRVRRAGS